MAGPEAETQYVDPAPRAGASARHAGIAAALTAVLLLGLVVASIAEVGPLWGILRFREDEEVEVFGLVLLGVWMLSTALTVGVFAAPGRVPKLALGAGVALRLTLLLSIVFMFVYDFLPQLENKSMTLRALVYPVVALAVPALYVWTGRSGPYPSVFDLSWNFVVTFDIVSNNLHWYGTWDDYDDFVHFANTVPYTLGLVLVLLALSVLGRLRIGLGAAVFFALLLNVSTHAAWEIWEHYMDVLLGTELQPGGMSEAATNTLWGAAAMIPAALLVRWWQRQGVLVSGAVDPLARLLAAGWPGLTRPRRPAASRPGPGARPARRP